MRKPPCVEIFQISSIYKEYARLHSFLADTNIFKDNFINYYNIYLALWDNNKKTAPTDIRRGCFVIVIV